MDWREEADEIYEFIVNGLARHIKREEAIAEMLPVDDETRDAAKQLLEDEIRREVDRFIEEATKESG